MARAEFQGEEKGKAAEVSGGTSEPTLSTNSSGLVPTRPSDKPFPPSYRRSSISPLGRPSSDEDRSKPSESSPLAAFSDKASPTGSTDSGNTVCAEELFAQTARAKRPLFRSEPLRFAGIIMRRLKQVVESPAAVSKESLADENGVAAYPRGEAVFGVTGFGKSEFTYAGDEIDLVGLEDFRATDYLPNRDISYYEKQIPANPTPGRALPESLIGEIKIISNEPQRLPNGKLTNAEAKRVIAENSGIADVSVVRNMFLYGNQRLQLALSGTEYKPVDLFIAQRERALKEPELDAFWGGIFENDKVVKGALVRMREQGKTSVDRSFTTPEDFYNAALTEIFADEEGLLPELMQAVDARVTRSSEENLAMIDAAPDEAPIKKDVVIIGGGPVTSLLATQLSPYRDVIVITDQRKLGAPWRYRPLWINSSTEVLDPTAPRLPLQDGTTTPISIAQSTNAPGTDILTGTESLVVLCDDGTVRRYVSGKNLGNLTAVTTAFTDSDFITQQKALPTESEVLPDGTTLLTFVDVNTGKKRQIIANDVIYANGPGTDVAKFEDEDSKLAYKEAQMQLDLDITAQRMRINELNAEIAAIQSQNLGEEGTTMIAEREAQLGEVRLTLPTILSLSMIEKITEFWEEDLGADPERWPFAPLFEDKVRAANCGSGDGAKIIDEFLNKMGPRSAYPKAFDREDPSNRPLTIRYNTTQSVDEYRQQQRNRYKDSYTDRTRGVSARVLGLETRTNNRLLTVGIVTGASTAFVNYAFVTTGIERQAIEDQFPFPMQKLIYDNENNGVALGSIQNGNYIVGTAAGLQRFGYPEQIQNILDVLEIENSASLWLNQLLVERFGWTFLDRKGPNLAKVKGLITKSPKK